MYKNGNLNKTDLHEFMSKFNKDPRGDLKYDIFGYDKVDCFFKENRFIISTVLTAKITVDSTVVISEIVLKKGKFYVLKLRNEYIDSNICIAFDKHSIYVYADNSVECKNTYYLPINLDEDNMKDKNIKNQIYDLIHSALEGFMESNKIDGEDKTDQK